MIIESVKDLSDIKKTTEFKVKLSAGSTGDLDKAESESYSKRVRQ